MVAFGSHYRLFYWTSTEQIYIKPVISNEAELRYTLCEPLDSRRQK